MTAVLGCFCRRFEFTPAWKLALWALDKELLWSAPDAGTVYQAQADCIAGTLTTWHGGNLGVNLSQDAISPAKNQPRELQGAEITLSDKLVAAWTNFAATGNPNGTGAMVWPVFATNSQTFLSQNLISSAYSGVQFFIDHKCDFWYPCLGYPAS
jgi:carboxylesterase type B